MAKFEKNFPLNRAFLDQMQVIADEASKYADGEALKLGKSVPALTRSAPTWLRRVRPVTSCRQASSTAPGLAWRPTAG